MNSEDSQIINELVQIKKEVINVKKQMSGAVAFGTIGASLIIGIAFVLIQLALRR